MIKRLLIILLIIMFAEHVRANDKREFIPEKDTVRDAYYVSKYSPSKGEEHKVPDLYAFASYISFTSYCVGYNLATTNIYKNIFSSENIKKTKICFERSVEQIIGAIFRHFEDGELSGDTPFKDAFDNEINSCFQKALKK